VSRPPGRAEIFRWKGDTRFARHLIVIRPKTHNHVWGRPRVTKSTTVLGGNPRYHACEREISATHAALFYVLDDVVCIVSVLSSASQQRGAFIMIRYANKAIGRRLPLWVFLIAPFAIVLSAVADEKKISNGWPMAQLHSRKGSQYLDKGNRDLIANRPVHSLFCLGAELKCCVESKGGGYSNCEDLGSVAPQVDITCGDKKQGKGVWTPDPKTIKALSDKKSCSQIYRCNQPSELPPIARAANCKAVVSVSHKEVEQHGTGVPGSSPGTCSSCLSAVPNEPCNYHLRNEMINPIRMVAA
jgi:hypothetical protein